MNNTPISTTVEDLASAPAAAHSASATSVKNQAPIKAQHTPATPKEKPLVDNESQDLWLRRTAHMLVNRLVLPLLGLTILLAIWQGVSMTPDTKLPGPAATWTAAVDLFSDPFYREGPNDQGVGWNVLASLWRVAIGFGIAALIGIPTGFLLGRFASLSSMVGPIISLLRPVSPLAWLPIGLLVFQRADPAATWTIFICSIWPMILNTAQGVTRVPQDYLNVARVLNLSEWKVFKSILFPAVLPYMLTGIKLSISTAWLVIVAAEMLTGGVGIGFWVWDEWNNLKVENIIIAIFVIGIVGLLLEQMLVMLAKRFTYENV